MPRHVLILFLCLLLPLLDALLLGPSASANGILTAAGPGSTPAAGGVPGRTTQPVRLTRHEVKAVVTGEVAVVTVRHTFHSDASRPLEGTYLFPLPEGAVVSAFAMTMGGKLVRGEVIEADKARAIYNGIVRRRLDPGILEYMGRGLFRARVFPIEPGRDLQIELSFQQVLPQSQGVLEFHYPLATERLNGSPVEHTAIDIQIDGQVDLKAIYSPSHAIRVERAGEKQAHIQLSQSARRQDKDLLLYIARSPEEVGFSLMSHKAAGEDGTFMAILSPSRSAAQEAPLEKDIAFVLDTSGSMEGQKLRQAQAALRYGISKLRPGDRFNVLSFATAVRSWREGLVAATDETKAAAIAWVDRLEARGSTNASQALADAVALHRFGRLSPVVFLTDGRPTIGIKDPSALVSTLQPLNTGQARVFTFGVGDDLDVAWLDCIAEDSGGARDYVAPGQDIELVTGRFFDKVSMPVMTDVRVDLGAGVYDIYPPKIGDLFAGEQVVVYGRYKESGPRTIRLHGSLAGEALVRTYASVLAATERHDFLPRLWANRKVAFLLDQLRLHGTQKELVDEVVHLATRYAIVTPYTAGLVVEDEAGARSVSESRLFQIGGGALPGGGSRRHGRSGGPGGQYRGPGSTVPPGLREPSDPTPAAPPPPSGPPTTPAPALGSRPLTPPAPTTPAAVSQDLKRRKAAGGAVEEDGLRAVRDRVQVAGGRTFTLRKDGRWIDTSWDVKAKPTSVKAFSEAWLALLEKDPRIAKYFAIGKRVVFLFDGQAYEVVP